MEVGKHYYRLSNGRFSSLKKSSKIYLILSQGSIVDWKGDIIVNAANERCDAGAGVCGAIFAKAGLAALVNEIRTGVRREPEGSPIQRNPNGKYCATGEAVYTRSCGSLKDDNGVEFIIHAVGPDLRGMHDRQRQQAKGYLAGAFKSSLKIAIKLKKNDGQLCQTIAFPAISTGIYGYDMRIAAKDSLEAIHEFFQSINSEEIEAALGLNRIEIILFKTTDLQIWINEAEILLGKAITE